MRGLWLSFSGLGLLLGALFLAASLTPSLIPRNFVLQGVLAGVCFGIGYLLGVFLLALWEYLGLPLARSATRRNATWLAAAVAVAIVLTYVWRATEWQNSIRERMEMPLVEHVQSFEMLAIAAGIFLLVLFLGRLFGLVFGFTRRRLARYVPDRVSKVIGATVAVLVFYGLVDGVIFREFLRLSDNAFSTLDALIEPDHAPPPNGTGSAESLVSWEDLGRAGREFVSSGPTAEAIGAFTGRPAQEPIRVYVGLNAAEEVEQRAQLALDEMIRAGAFERSVLLVVVPTGTGWMDPEAMNPFEYLHGGDTATVALQYSYLTSWISLLVEPGYGSDSGRALFRAVYRHWTSLPRDARPRLYLHGLSLGAYSSEQSFELHEVLADPFNGAVWSGPPFSSPVWKEATRNRNPGTPAWLPVYGDSSIIRFTIQENALDIPGATWGPMRLVYVQHGSDPITFFSPDALWRKPDWMNAPLAPDVSPELRWFPVVTFLQLALDMAIGLAVPPGYGHLFAAGPYIDAFVEVTQPSGWTPAEIDRLKAHFLP